MGQKQISRYNNGQELSRKDSDSIRHVPRIDKWYYTIKTLLHHKENSLHREETAYRNEEKIFANHTSDKESISRIYNQL